MLRKIRQTALLGVAAFAVAGTAHSQNEQFIPMNGYWVGPYAAGGSGIFGGFIDYVNMVNARDGRVFPWVFPLITNYWSQNTAKIKFIGMKEGGMEKLKGKKIVNVYHDSAYGKETIPVLDAQAAKYGFEVTHIPVAHPGNEQQAQWLQVRQIKPDWVILRGWGVMNPTALKAAAKVGFPREKMIGVWWSGAEEDVLPAGSAAKGFISSGFNAPGTEFPVMKDVKKFVYDKGKGEFDDKARFGSIYHTR